RRRRRERGRRSELPPRGVRLARDRAGPGPRRGGGVVSTATTRRYGSAIRPRLPRIGTSLGIAVGAAVSLAPGLLPRTAGAQAILTGLLVAVALGLGASMGWALRRGGFGRRGFGRRGFGGRGFD